MKKALASIILVASLVAFAVPALASMKKQSDDRCVYTCERECQFCGCIIVSSGCGKTKEEAASNAERSLAEAVINHSYGHFFR